MQIIIVDDNPLNLRRMQDLIARAGEAPPRTFPDSAEALAWCADNVPDLLIIDSSMPTLDGMEFVRRFREQPRHAGIPVLMIMADHGEDARHALLECGASDFLHDPIDAVEFRLRLRNMLALRRGQMAQSERDAGLTERIAEATAHLLDQEQEMITRLARAAEFRDPNRGAHIQRIAHYSRLIAQQLGLPAGEQALIQRAAPMHDVGKIAISEDILLKPGRLDPDEFEIMKTHAEMGYVLLSGSGFSLLDAAALIARSHHEKFDGSGYPLGLAGEDIPLHGRIVAVADVFDALTSERPYKRAWEIEHALRFLEEGAGNHFDPACVQAFIAQIDRVLEIRARYQDAGPVLAQP